MAYDTEDAELKRQQRRQAKADREAKARNDAVFQGIMAHPGSRAWMHELLTMCHIFAPSFAGEQTHRTAFAEGERNIGLILLAGIMAACPEAYIQMMGEANGGRPDTPRDKSDPDDDRNYDAGGQWIGDGDGPEGQ